jgi:enterochelin esterase family protein
MRTGTVVIERVESEALRGNPLGDPWVRQVPVYLPPSYAREPARRYPAVFVLAGFTGRGRMLLNDDPWQPSLPDRMDRLIGEGRCGEMILVMPDCFTRFGGSQYLDSSALGRYEHHLIHELVPWVDSRYRTLAAREHRGVAGKSSGGYGALVHAMKHPDVFGACVSHSGDVGFDYCYRGDLPAFIEAVQGAGGLQAWFEKFEAKPRKEPADLTALNILAMAAAYSPHPAASETFGVDLPCDLATGAFRPEVWARWLEHDPLHLLERHAAALRSLKLLYLDCGTRDEWHLHLGARLFTARLRELGVPHEYEEFDDGHRNIPYRYDVSLPKLARAMTVA